MKQEGHIGLSLLTISPIILILVLTENTLLSLLFISTVAILSTLPDIDIVIQGSIINKVLGIQHRGITHTILFSLIIGLITTVIYYTINTTLLFAFVGFLAGFIGILSHIFGDIMTPTGVNYAPRYKNDNYSFDLFNYNNVIANYGFFVLGIYSVVLPYALNYNMDLSLIVGNYLILSVLLVFNIFLAQKISWRYKRGSIPYLKYLRLRNMIKLIFRI